MKRFAKGNKVLAGILVLVFLMLAAVPDSYAQRRRRPSKTKHIAVGTAVGAVGGALIGGRKGALIGAGAGAGTGYMVYRHKKRKAARRY
ncbi:MAG TPA: YMGG-like glycine zipper-containing protein [Blastocatellia bacterium]|nr:YMGG-like glycine zipper-containing protein [Blastocatellia bacterium]